MLELVRRIEQDVIQQAKDIFEHFGAEPVFNFEPDAIWLGSFRVTFTYKTKYFNGKTKVFYYVPTKTHDDFINEIKAYMLDCVDTFINLL